MRPYNERTLVSVRERLALKDDDDTVDAEMAKRLLDTVDCLAMRCRESETILTEYVARSAGPAAYVGDP